MKETKGGFYLVAWTCKLDFSTSALIFFWSSLNVPITTNLFIYCVYLKWLFKCRLVVTTAPGKAPFFSLLHQKKKVCVATAFSDSDVTGKANKVVFVLCGRVYRCWENENKHDINFISVCLSCSDAAV